jgi:vancomycin resistance protein YoaR
MNKTPSSIFKKALSALLLGLGAVLAVAFAFIGLILILYSGRILPGVTLNGIALGGLNRSQAIQTVAASYSFPQTGHILLQAGEQSWMVSPAQIGVYLDTETTVDQALQIGRRHPLELIQTALFGKATSPVFIYDQRVALQYLEQLASLIDQPVKEASLSIENAQVVVNQGQIGRVLDLSGSLQALGQQIRAMQDGVVQLAVTEVAPKVLDVTQQGEQVKAILSQPFTLNLPAAANTPTAGPWVIQPNVLAGLLAFSESKDGQAPAYTVEVSQPLMTAYLQTLESQIDQEPQNARFIFNDDTRQLDLKDHAVIGRQLDLTGSVSAINEQLLSGSHSAELAITSTQPQVGDNATAADLGITELVGEYTTYFRGSSAERVQNITTAADSFKGLLVAPGATVSMADVLGNITLDNGYAEAAIIVGDQTIQGVGGGVCQVSTTLFRTVFFSGYPILERHAHAYRVGYYEQVNSSGAHNSQLAGLDATVFVPLVDFKFKNDTPYWLLMETYVSPSNYSLTWKFYSTSDGRQVTWDTTGPTDPVDPPDPKYVENPELPAGTVKQTDWAVQGADVSVDRTVTRNGEVIDSDHFVTQYEPWPDIYEYGPGTENMPPASAN